MSNFTPYLRQGVTAESATRFKHFFHLGQIIFLALRDKLSLRVLVVHPNFRNLQVVTWLYFIIAVQADIEVAEHVIKAALTIRIFSTHPEVQHLMGRIVPQRSDLVEALPR